MAALAGAPPGRGTSGRSSSAGASAIFLSEAASAPATGAACGVTTGASLGATGDATLAATGSTALRVRRPTRPPSATRMSASARRSMPKRS